jgi:hypothetical protein
MFHTEIQPELAQGLVDAAVAQKAVHMIVKDVDWLWRTAYNTAVTGCSEWDDKEDEVADLFDIARHVRRFFFSDILQSAEMGWSLWR